MVELRSAVDECRFSAGFHVGLVPDAATSTIAFVLRVTETPRLDEWALLFADGVHNARASLDHLAWQLAWVASDLLVEIGVRFGLAFWVAASHSGREIGA
jgi:hypothetical protein